MIVSILSASMTSDDAKKQAGSNSPLKGGGVFLDQHGNQYGYEPGENWYSNHEEAVVAGEKEALFGLKDQGYQSSLRRPRSIGGAMPEPPAEWDHLVVSATREETELLKGHEAAVMEALVEALHKTPNGRRMMAISFAHDDTGNLHWHINLHRFAVDHEAKTISTSMDLTKNSVVHQTLARINEVMRERGLLELSDFVSRDGRPLSADRGVPPEVHHATKTTIQEAGAVDITEPPTSLVRGAVSPDLARIAQAETVTRQEIAQVETEIQKLRELANRKATTLGDIQSAKSALTERDHAIQARLQAEADRDAALAERDSMEKRAVHAESVQGQLTGEVMHLSAQIDELKMRIEDNEVTIEERDERITELEGHLKITSINLQTAQEQLETATTVSKKWEEAARESFEANASITQERNGLLETVEAMENELHQQAERFKQEIEEQNRAAQEQIDALTKQFQQQAQQAESFIKQLSEQNLAGQKQIENLTTQLQQQTERFAAQMAEQSKTFAKQLEKALSAKGGKSQKAIETKAPKAGQAKPVAKKSPETKPVKADQAPGSLRDKVNTRLKEALDKKKAEGLRESTKPETQAGQPEKDDSEKE